MTSLRHGNLSADPVPLELPDELVTVLAESSGVRIQRIVSRGHSSPPDFWYDQEEHEFVLLVDGAARLDIEGQGERCLNAGDWVVLPAHTRHRVSWTRPDLDTVWLAVFYR